MVLYTVPNTVPVITVVLAGNITFPVLATIPIVAGVPIILAEVAAAFSSTRLPAKLVTVPDISITAIFDTLVTVSSTLRFAAIVVFANF